MNKPNTKDVQTAAKNGWKTARDITVALAPTVITVVACAIIVKQLDKD